MTVAKFRWSHYRFFYVFICGILFFFLTKGKLGLLQFVPCTGKYIHFRHLAFKFPLYSAVL